MSGTHLPLKDGFNFGRAISPAAFEFATQRARQLLDSRIPMRGRPDTATHSLLTAMYLVIPQKVGRYPVAVAQQVMLGYLREIIANIDDPAALEEVNADGGRSVLPGTALYAVLDCLYEMSANADEYTSIIGTELLQGVKDFPNSDELIVLRNALGSTGAASFSSTIAVEPTGLDFDSLLEKMHALVGLEQVKCQVKSEASLAAFSAERRRRRLPVVKPSRHMVFAGNPGTGKTTVARLIGEMYHQLGVLSRGHLVEVGPAGLMGQHLGENTQRAQAVIDSARGGVLLVDEAYSLNGDERGPHLFAREVIDVLVKSMEDFRDDLVVIFTGYEGPMKQFLSTNPGLDSRVGTHILFPDYTNEELAEVFMRMAAEHSLTLDAEVTELLVNGLSLVPRGERFGNARMVRNLFEDAASSLASRLGPFLATAADEELSLITAADVNTAFGSAPKAPVQRDFGFTRLTSG